MLAEVENCIKDEMKEMKSGSYMEPECELHEMQVQYEQDYEERIVPLRRRFKQAADMLMSRGVDRDEVLRIAQSDDGPGIHFGLSITEEDIQRAESMTLRVEKAALSKQLG